MKWRFAASGVVAAVSAPLWMDPNPAASFSISFTQAPRSRATPACADMGKSILASRHLTGMRVVVAEFDRVAETVRVISEGFLSASGPAYSQDGSRLIFSGKRNPEDHLQVWEWSAQDPRPRSIVACEADCVSPLYLPNGDVVFASLLSSEYEEHGGSYSFSLYKARRDGDPPERLTFNPSSDFDPAVLPDGRILYSSWQHVGNHLWPTGTVALMLVNSDGTGVFPFTGNHRGPWLKRGSRPWTNDRIVLIQSDRFAEYGAGELVASSLNDAFAPYSVLVAADRYLVSGVAPLPDGALLLSARPADQTRPTFGLYVYRGSTLSLLYDDPVFDELDPAVGSKTAPPDILVSTVVPDTPHGYLVVLNCYETDRTDQYQLRQGSVRALRVIEGQPLRRHADAGPMFLSVAGREDEPWVRPSSATGYIPSRILGEVVPAPDGSVYLKVPPDRPLRIQLVDHDGFALMNERAWFWVRPNERRVCIGCHENRELSANNAVPLATRRAPTDLTDPGRWQTVSFRRNIEPIINQNCAVGGCHVPPTPTASLNLTGDRLNGGQDADLAEYFGPAYANLLARQPNKPFALGGRRVHPGNARGSPLLWMLYGRALAPQYKPAPFDRPMISAHPGPMLPEAQLDLIRKWIDLGAPYDDDSPAGPWPYKTLPVKTVTKAKDEVNGK